MWRDAIGTKAAWRSDTCVMHRGASTECATNDDQCALLVIVECLGDLGEVLLDAC